MLFSWIYFSTSMTSLNLIWPLSTVDVFDFETTETPDAWIRNQIYKVKTIQRNFNIFVAFRGCSRGKSRSFILKTSFKVKSFEFNQNRVIFGLKMGKWKGIFKKSSFLIDNDFKTGFWNQNLVNFGLKTANVRAFF